MPRDETPSTSEEGRLKLIGAVHCELCESYIYAVAEDWAWTILVKADDNIEVVHSKCVGRTTENWEILYPWRTYEWKREDVLLRGSDELSGDGKGET